MVTVYTWKIFMDKSYIDRIKFIQIIHRDLAYSIAIEKLFTYAREFYPYYTSYTYCGSEELCR